MSPNTIMAGQSNGKDYRLLFFSEMVNKRICETRKSFQLGKLSDLVFHLTEPYPTVVGIFIDHGWGNPTEFIPWDRVVRIEKDAIFVQPPANGEQYPPFVDQPKWILLNQHLMGKEILDMDGLGIEMVNDVHLLESKGHMIIVHVDISFNGFLRKWGLGWLHRKGDQLISWKYVQPLSLEDVSVKDKMSLSITRNQIHELPSEDLADALEELQGEEQQAIFSALDNEKAAETLLETEPRAQRQIVANLKAERARAILSEMSNAQLADLLSVLPLEDRNDLIALLPADQAQRIEAILSEHEAKAGTLMNSDFAAMTKETTVAEALQKLRAGDYRREVITYIYIVTQPDNVLLGVVDLRELVTSDGSIKLSDIMASPVISAEETDLKDDLAQLFAKYHFRMIPVVDKQEHILGIIHHNDIMKGLMTKTRF
jgi:magnesium transporter